MISNKLQNGGKTGVTMENLIKTYTSYMCSGAVKEVKWNNGRNPC